MVEFSDLIPAQHETNTPFRRKPLADSYTQNSEYGTLVYFSDHTPWGDSEYGDLVDLQDIWWDEHPLVSPVADSEYGICLGIEEFWDEKKEADKFE